MNKKLEAQKEKRKLLKVDDARSENTSLSKNPKFTRGEVASHNSFNDCWIILRGKVYNVTPYIQAHPGGSMALLNCSGTGKDYKGDFDAVGHSMSALNKLRGFYIGDIK